MDRLNDYSLGEFGTGACCKVAGNFCRRKFCRDVKQVLTPSE